MSTQAFVRHLRQETFLSGCTPLLQPPRPSREPAKPFHRGLNSMLSRSTSAPQSSRTALQHWKLCHFHPGFHYLSPQMSAAVTVPAGDLTKTAASFPQSPSPRCPHRPLHVPGPAHHSNIKTTWTSQGTNQQAPAGCGQFLCWGDGTNGALGAVSLRTHDSCWPLALCVQCLAARRQIWAQALFRAIGSGWFHNTQMRSIRKIYNQFLNLQFAQLINTNYYWPVIVN